MAHAASPFGVSNTYATLEELKQRLAISSGTETYDRILWKLLHLASRHVDRRCGRRFFVMSATRRFDVLEVSGFPVTDLVQVAQLAEDRDCDGVYETLRQPAGYVLYPLDSEPETAYGEPYRRVQCAHDDASDGFAIGSGTVKVSGQWGFRSHWVHTGATVRSDAPIGVADQTFFVNDDTALAAGQTVQIGHEQMFVRQVAARTIGVARGVNGTTAAAHAGGAQVKVQVHPAEVAEATLLTAVDRWIKRDGYRGAASENGRAVGLAAQETRDLLAPFMRLGF